MTCSTTHKGPLKAWLVLRSDFGLFPKVPFRIDRQSRPPCIIH